MTANNHIPVLKPGELKAFCNGDDIVMVDTRCSKAFVEMHIPGSVFCRVQEGGMPMLSKLLPGVHSRILLIADKNDVGPIAAQLQASGYDHCVGYQDAKEMNWKEINSTPASIVHLSPEAFADLLDVESPLDIVDVRGARQYQDSHIAGATNIPYWQMDQLVELTRTNSSVYVYGETSNDALLIISFIKKAGLHNLVLIDGGYDDLCNNGRFYLA